MTKPRVQLKIENFGPIVEGTVEFKPLTFLIGPNNSGKSYVATLLYALSQALRDGVMHGGNLPTPEAAREVTQFLVQQSRSGIDKLVVAELPPQLRNMITGYLGSELDRARHRIDERLRQYYSVENLSELARGGRERRLLLAISSQLVADPHALVMIHASDAKSGIEIEIDRTLAEHIEIPSDALFARLVQEPQFVPLNLALHRWFTVVGNYGYRHPHAFYLPAARSGILASWPLLASLAVRSVSRSVGRQQADIAPLPGVIGDFLEDVIGRFSPLVGANGRDHDRAPLQPVLDIVEGQLLRGRVIIEERQPFAAELIYESEGLRLPLQRTSSMVGELAPVDLWVRELLEPGDLLIIDEPESHLHPENQRLIARALVRLVNAGVDVVAPTHSSTILHQVSNLLLGSEVDDETRAKLGFTEHDRLSQDNVAVYLFEPRADGTHIVPVPIESGFGISEEEFVRVSEAIGDESFQLTFAAAQQPV